MGKNVYEERMSENLKKKLNTGIIPAVHLEEDFFSRDVSINSWFGIGRFEVEDHTVGYLFQLMSMDRPNAEPVLNVNFSLTDETTGWYRAEDHIYPMKDVEMTENGTGSDKTICMKTPVGSLTGNLFHMHWKADMEGGSIDLEMEPYGMPIYNAGSGYFTSIFEGPFHQYSIPCLKTKGTLKIEDHVYTITEDSGRCWFDRQWQEEKGPDFIGTTWQWSWMDLNLDNGDVLSLWDMRNVTHDVNNCWATVMHEDGTQSTCTVETLKTDADRFWKSEKSGQNYPTHWIVKIPELDARLEVTPVVKESEIVSSIPFLNKYEGASVVKGTYKGKETSGYCYVELLGEWK